MNADISRPTTRQFHSLVEVVRVERDGLTCRITATVPARWWWPWGRRVTRTWEGGSTVWHDVETGRRAGPVFESELSAIDWLDLKRARDAQKARDRSDDANTSVEGGNP